MPEHVLDALWNVVCRPRLQLHGLAKSPSVGNST
jgi:hypothetical protein